MSKAKRWNRNGKEKYPILISYQKEVNAEYYAQTISDLLDQLKQEYHYNEQDAMLVLKDILYQVWKYRKKNNK